MYKELKPEKIISTTQILLNRISERFPGSGLSQVAGELLSVCERATDLSAWLARPIIALRIAVAASISLILFFIFGTMLNLEVRLTVQTFTDFLQAFESAINDVVFVGIAVLFLATWETRIKRRKALKAIHELRSLSHIIDMHQLTKDPERVMRKGMDTESSPKRTMTAFELTRYLDYCSEMLAIISKIAAIYIQNFDDHVTILAVNDLESLTTELSGKIWQKIMIMGRLLRKNYNHQGHDSSEPDLALESDQPELHTGETSA